MSSGGGSLDHPTAFVRPAAGSEADIEIISAPGCAAGRLEQPGAALLVRAADQGKLQIGVKKSGASGALDAAFRLESVGSLSIAEKTETNNPAQIADRGRAHLPQINAARNAQAPTEALFVAHISRRGDVRVAPGEWAGGPETPGRIEGLEIELIRQRWSARRTSSPSRDQSAEMVRVDWRWRVCWKPRAK